MNYLWMNNTGGEATHPDPEINKLYEARRKAAEATDGTGFSAMKGWDELERIARELTKLDPDGDWRYEVYRLDGRGWQVRRP